ncbi:MAG: SprT-like domain-containing protein [Bacteroidetes bacterium]|nr:SprT-like domain-containing protein [Bacteroidota bacterium]
MTREQIIAGFKRYVPNEFADFCTDLLVQYKVDLRVKRPRNTKSGDYRPPVQGRKKHQVTVNSDLNPYYFLLVYIHEMAHVKTWEDYGRKAEPHGQEWRQIFKEMSKPVLNSGLLPKDLQIALQRFFEKTPATFLADSNLTKVLRQYDKNAALLTVDEIPMGGEFKLNNGLHLIKESRLRTWYMCKEVTTGRQFRVKGNAEVQQFDKQQ